ncbi:MAG: hypothetical protein AAFY88_06520, partial [Acidobacteriota bacterium]
EGVKGETPVDWIQAGLLPSHFLTRHDGSELVRGENGRYYDSLRGAAGGSILVAELALAQGRLPGLQTPA